MTPSKKNRNDFLGQVFRFFSNNHNPCTYSLKGQVLMSFKQCAMLTSLPFIFVTRITHRGVTKKLCLGVKIFSFYFSHQIWTIMHGSVAGLKYSTIIHLFLQNWINDPYFWVFALFHTPMAAKSSILGIFQFRLQFQNRASVYFMKKHVVELYI